MNGSWIRERRKAHGWSQTTLANKVGVSQVQISSWETEKSKPSERYTAKLAELLGQPDAASSGAMPLRVAGAQSAPYAQGAFVAFRDQSPSRVGIGRVVEHASGEVNVEVFRSPAPPEREALTLSEEQARPIDLRAQTLVYVRESTRWALGRLVSGEIRGHYAVRFPNAKDAVAIAARDVFVRCPRSTDDPSDLLAAQITSSPFFTEARHNFTEFVTTQRSAYKGLTALATARIELHAHQLAAVRRVLSDPVHRYLLADEVGLGKTIEAGLLVSQHLIDEGENASVVLIVPDALVDQWGQELAKSFGVRNDPRITVVPFTGLDGANGARLASRRATLTVVDEAHQTATWAFADDRSGLLSARYQTLEELARCPKVLLLSGTPVLHHEDGFLAMLHLLEPEAYELGDREGFRRRVGVRKVVAEALSELTTDFQPDFLTEALTRLAGEVLLDEELQQRIAAVMSAVTSESSAAAELVEELRSYLLERYRLNRRMIRTHRDSKSVAHLLPKRCGVSFFSSADDLQRLRTDETLEEWRRRVLEAGFDRSGPATATFSDLLGGALCHPHELGRVLERRAHAIRETVTEALFPDEDAWCRDVAQELLSVGGADARTAGLAQRLSSALANRRVVIFIDSPEQGDSLVDHLRETADLGKRVVRFLPGASEVITLYEQRANTILVCDRRAEEGLNLQKKPATIVFYDLPFDIGRIEQRIGRFDRLEGMKDLRFLLAAPVGRYETGWARALAEQVKIFDRSVARLQYVLAETTQKLRADVLDAGPDEAFEAIALRFADEKTGLDALVKQLRKQEALDATEWRDEELSAFCETVATARTNSCDEARDAIEGWLRVVNFEVREHPESVVWFSYVRRDRGESTLIPLPDQSEPIWRWVDKNASGRSIDELRVAYGPFVFSPDDDHDGASQLGIGHPFFDTVFSRMELDDRSRSWGLWRIHAGATSPQVYLCFEFAIEASLANVPAIAHAFKTDGSGKSGTSRSGKSDTSRKGGVT